MTSWGQLNLLCCLQAVLGIVMSIPTQAPSVIEDVAKDLAHVT